MSHYKICQECGADIVVRGEKYVPVWSRNCAKLCNVPFECSACGGIHIPFQPTLDRVMVYADPVPDTYVEGGEIIIPSQHKAEKVSDYGTILAFGKGHYCSKRFHPLVDLHVGDKVIYDRTVPWGIDVKGSDGKMYPVKIMGALDIKIVLEEGNSV